MSELGHNNPPATISAEIEYKGYTIKVSEHYTFLPYGHDLPEQGYNYQQTLKGAKEVIDKHLKTLNAQERVSKNLKLKFRDSKGRLITFRGFHGRTGKALTDISLDPYSSGLYPDVPWITDLLLERTKLEQRNQQIGKLLNDYYIKSDVYGGVEAERYQAVVDKWIVEADYKVNAAIKKAPTETAVK